MLNETYRGMLAHKSVIRETFMYGKQRAAQIGYENVFDYSLGNPSVPCPERFTAAMQELLAQVFNLPDDDYVKTRLEFGSDSADRDSLMTAEEKEIISANE